MSDDAPKEGRKEPRADVVLKVEYPNAEGFLQDYTVNISRGGTMIRVSRLLRQGNHVELILSFPGLMAPVTLSGVVRWVQQEGQEDYTAGVEFIDQDPLVWRDLARLVEQIREGARLVVMPVLRILVVEDNLHVARLISDGISAYLKRSREQLAFETRHANNGREALSLMEEEPFDVLLVDMYLPVMDGESFIREVRGVPDWEQLPIIALSAGGSDARERAFAAGADFFLDKPLRLSDVLATMGKLMSVLQERAD